MVRLSGKALLNPYPVNDQPNLEHPLSDDRRQLRVRVREGVSQAAIVANAVLFAINLIANLLFTPIFAGLRNVPLAALDVLIVWATIIACAISIWRHYR